MTYTEEERKERQREACRKWRENNREHFRELNRGYAKKRREADPEYYRKVNKRWRENNPEMAAAHGFGQRHGFSTQEALEILAAKPSVCEICEQEGNLHYDHDHSTGLHRGWLCSRCNLSLGAFEDNIVWLQNAIEYLLKGTV